MALIAEQSRLSFSHLRDIAGANGTFTQVVDRIASRLGLNPNDLNKAATSALRTNCTKATFNVREFLEGFHLPEGSQVKIDQPPTDEELKGLLSTDGQARSTAISAFALQYDIDATHLRQDIAPCKREGNEALANLRGRIFKRLGLDAEGNIVVKTEAHPEPVVALEEMDATGAFTGSAPVSESLVDTGSVVGDGLFATNEFELPDSMPDVIPAPSTKDISRRVIEALFSDPESARFRKLLLVTAVADTLDAGDIGDLIELFTGHSLTKDLFDRPEDLTRMFADPKSRNYGKFSEAERGGGFYNHAVPMIRETYAKQIENLTRNLILKQPKYADILQILRKSMGCLNGTIDKEIATKQPRFMQYEPDGKNSDADLSAEENAKLKEFFNNKVEPMLSANNDNNGEAAILQFFKDTAENIILKTDADFIRERIGLLVDQGRLNTTQLWRLTNGKAGIEDGEVLRTIIDFCDVYFKSLEEFTERRYLLKTILDEKFDRLVESEPVPKYVPKWRQMLSIATPLGAYRFGKEVASNHPVAATAGLGLMTAALGPIIYLAQSGVETVPKNSPNQAQVVAHENKPNEQPILTDAPASLASQPALGAEVDPRPIVPVNNKPAKPEGGVEGDGTSFKTLLEKERARKVEFKQEFNLGNKTITLDKDLIEFLNGNKVIQLSVLKSKYADQSKQSSTFGRFLRFLIAYGEKVREEREPTEIYFSFGDTMKDSSFINNIGNFTSSDTVEGKTLLRINMVPPTLHFVFNQVTGLQAFEDRLSQGLKVSDPATSAKIIVGELLK